MNLFQEESFEMSLEPSSAVPTFADYSQALERLQRQATHRRAVMSCGLGWTLETLVGEEQERRDRALLELWESQNGPGWVGY